tara:strand:- start:30 stop:662 length:633 start_codon:yes stop_codon:yes gene_type:complete
MIKSLISLFILYTFFTISTSAALVSVGAQAGLVNFGENFNDSTHFGARLNWVSKTGFMIEGSGYYFQAESNTGSSDLKAGLGLIGANYALPILESVRPYVGAAIGFGRLSSAYDDSPSLAYSLKAGINLNVSKDLRAFGEASYFHISNKASLAIQPILITAGIGIDFGGSKENANRQSRPGNVYPYTPIKKKPVRRPSRPPRGPRPMPGR